MKSKFLLVILVMACVLFSNCKKEVDIKSIELSSEIISKAEAWINSEDCKALMKKSNERCPLLDNENIDWITSVLMLQK